MNQPTILIVDDEERIRKVLYDYFMKQNYQVKLAQNGEEAIDVFYANKIDLVILDIMMPVMDGYETLKELRKISNVPVMILSAKCFVKFSDRIAIKPASTISCAPQSSISFISAVSHASLLSKSFLRSVTPVTPWFFALSRA